MAASAGIQQNVNTIDVELIYQQMVLDDNNGPLPENTTPATMSNDTIFEKE